MDYLIPWYEYVKQREDERERERRKEAKQRKPDPQGTLFDVRSDGSVRYNVGPLSDTTSDIAHEVAKQAAELVSGDRNADYGHPLDDFTKQGLMWEQILGVPVTAEQVALCMVCVKIAREVHRPKGDNRVDGVGYFLTLAMIEDERRRRSGE